MSPKREHQEETPEQRKTKLAAQRERARLGKYIYVNEGVSRNYQRNAKPGLRLTEIVKKQGVSLYYKSNACIIAWHSSTTLPMIIDWVKIFKSGLCLKFVPIARPWNLMVKQRECVTPQEKLSFLNWLHHHSHWISPSTNLNHHQQIVITIAITNNKKLQSQLQSSLTKLKGNH